MDPDRKAKGELSREYSWTATPGPKAAKMPHGAMGLEPGAGPGTWPQAELTRGTLGPQILAPGPAAAKMPHRAMGLERRAAAAGPRQKMERRHVLDQAGALPSYLGEARTVQAKLRTMP